MENTSDNILHSNVALEHRVRDLKAKWNAWCTERSFWDLKKMLLDENVDMNAVESHSIIRALRAYLEDNRNEKIIPCDKLFYRARFVKPPYHIQTQGNSFAVSKPVEIAEQTTITGYDEENSKEPSIGHSSSQRASQKYASYLYLAEDKYTACSEIKTVQRSIISLARFKSLKNLRVIDFFNWNENTGSYTEEMNETEYLLLTGLIAFAFTIPVIDEKEYYFTQFIADMIRKYGFDGIVYKSFYSNMQNYVIFNCAPNAIKFVDSELIIHYSQTNCFFSINDLTDITHEDACPPIDIKRKIKYDILSEFKR